MEDSLVAFCPEGDIRIAGAVAGPLAGLRFALKDLFDLEGVVAGSGNPDWRRTHRPAERTAPVVGALLEAGASVFGKTVMDELAYGLGGENVHYGTPVNPKAPGRVAGGSSSGSASAVAGEVVDFALGTDTGGSVRVPASYCGVFGIRPTHGRVPLDGVLPVSPSFDVVGWFAREPELMLRVGKVLLDWRDQAALPERALVAEDAFALADGAAGPALREAAARVARVIGGARRVRLAEDGFESWGRCFRTIQGREAWASHGAWIEGVRPVFGPLVAERFRWASTVGEADAARARGERGRIARRILELLADGSVLVLPTGSGAAPLRGAAGEELASVRARTLALTCIAGLAGAPQITLPLAESEGCPVGVSLVARPGGDEGLLELAVGVYRALA